MQSWASARYVLVSVFERIFPKLLFDRRLKNTADEKEIAILPFLTNRDRASIDVGANIGKFSMELSRLSKNVYAFEPNKNLSRILIKCLPSNVEVLDCALSAQSGVSELNMPLMHGQYDKGRASLQKFSGAPSFSSLVKTRTLNEWKDKDIGFVKIDVEGHEFDVLSGAKELIEASRPNFLIEVEERHRVGSVDLVKNFFRENQYVGYFIQGKEVRSVDEFHASNQNLFLDGSLPLSGYVNNLWFIPLERNSEEILLNVKSQINRSGF